MPAVLLEPGHITNSAEERLLNDEAFAARLARSIAHGLRRFARDPAPV
jgi:N-acetylmuramoyl-L-alanine amidase